MRKIAIVTGVTGQDGSFLAELLLEKGYHTIGLIRRSSTNNLGRLSKIIEDKNFILLESDLTDANSITSVINRYKPDELYNTAAQSHVATSFDQPVLTFNVNTGGVLNLLEAIRRFSQHTKFIQFSTSEMFGSNYSTLELLNKTIKYQDEKTPFSPNSPYAASKVAAHNLVNIYRKSYGLHASCSIMFNHESPRRGENFVTKKITQYVAKLKHHRCLLKSLRGNDLPPLKLGNLYSSRDWGYAPDYMEAVWQIVQQKIPNDYVISTNITHTIREFLDEAFSYIGIKNWSKYIEIDNTLYRPCEVEYLRGSYDKINKELGWKPKTSFRELVKIMIDYDLQKLQRPGI